MNYDVLYVSAPGKIDEEYAEVKITMPIKERADAQKFVLELKKNNLIAKRIWTLIRKCETERDEIINGKTAKLPEFSGDKELWNSILEERIKYLDSFMSKLKFIYETPEKDMIV